MQGKNTRLTSSIKTMNESNFFSIQILFLISHNDKLIRQFEKIHFKQTRN